MTVTKMTLIMTRVPTVTAMQPMCAECDSPVLLSAVIRLSQLVTVTKMTLIMTRVPTVTAMQPTCAECVTVQCRPSLTV